MELPGMKEEGDRLPLRRSGWGIPASAWLELPWIIAISNGSDRCTSASRYSPEREQEEKKLHTRRM